MLWLVFWVTGFCIRCVGHFVSAESEWNSFTLRRWCYDTRTSFRLWCHNQECLCTELRCQMGRQSIHLSFHPSAHSYRHQPTHKIEKVGMVEDDVEDEWERGWYLLMTVTVIVITIMMVIVELLSVFWRNLVLWVELGMNWCSN